MDFVKMNRRLQELRAKYAVAADGALEGADHAAGAVLNTSAATVYLLPWRIERRFVELRKLVTDQTLEDVSTLRFANMSATRPLPQLIYREVDLCDFLLGDPLREAFAVRHGDKVAHIVASSQTGRNISIECSAALPAGTLDIDRHEIIARRGVASDRVVDTQVPQASIYAFGEAGLECHTDTDAELFGLQPAEILAVRAAFAVLKDNSLATEWNAIHQRLATMTAEILHTDETRSPVIFA